MSEKPASEEGGNAAQRRYWNSVAGPRWIAHRALMEDRNRAVNDILLSRAAPAAGERILEIGCGTGATTFLLADAVGSRGRVLGIDIAQPMLSFAEQRLSERQLPHVSLILADAQEHPFERETFDLAVSRFGVMFFADPVAAFANVRGALRPGGRLAFACWGPMAENQHWLIAYDVALRHLGPPAPQPIEAPGPMSLSDPTRTRAILAQAGFAEIDISRERTLVMGGSAEEEAAHALRMGPTARLVEEKKPDDGVIAVMRGEIAEAFAKFAEGGPMRLPATIFLVTARRPG